MQGLGLIRHVLALLSTLFSITTLGFIFWTGVIVAFSGWSPTVVMSGSMEPAIKAGYILFADPMTAEETRSIVKQGHVLLAEDPARPGTLVTHRVMEFNKEKDAFITRGDANPKNDSTPVPVDNVKGLERIAVPYLGIPYQAAKTGDFIPLTFFTVLLLISVFMMKREWEIACTNERNRQQKSGASLTPDEAQAKNKQKAIASLMSFTLISGVTFGGAETFTGSYAAFQGSTKNLSNTFQAKASFNNFECWDATQTKGDFRVTFTKTGPMGVPETWSPLVNIQLINSDNSSIFLVLESKDYVDSAYISGAYMDITLVGTTHSRNFEPDGRLGALMTLPASNLPIAVNMKIYKKTKPTTQYWASNFSIRRC